MLRVALLFFGLTQSNLNCDQESPSGGKHPQKMNQDFFAGTTRLQDARL